MKEKPLYTMVVSVYEKNWDTSIKQGTQTPKITEEQFIEIVSVGLDVCGYYNGFNKEANK